MTTRPGRRATDAGLNYRERQILTYLAEGWNDHEIGEQLGLASETVRRLVYDARIVLGANTRIHAVALALKAGAIQPRRRDVDNND